ncbi:hypothetical protein PZ897_19260 [Hoeflea sp. YIM 152468]|uniref:hypothetical protein n=1 Tax=Hoeflea sp. YIM 152468 TaxID=3031759 RepID=UPI0023DAF721|nr:hypothetical protein [Hoeflea sp. YIM 152468]MDF1610325.1 hypothetical protein [Hoeflea sp. YIM 152468]
MICDLGKFSSVATLYQSSSVDGDNLKISVAGYIEEAPWLNASLWDSETGETILQCEIGHTKNIDLVLECAREPTDDEIAEASRDLFALSITLQSKRGDGQSQNLRVELAGLRLQTLIWQPPLIQPRQAAIPEISRVEKQDHDEVDLFNINVKQPVARLEFGGDPVNALVSGRLSCLVDDEIRVVSAELSLDTVVARSTSGVACELRAGHEVSIACIVSINEIFEVAESADSLQMQFEWNCIFSDESQTPLSGVYDFGLQLRQGEILALKYRDASAVPNMTRSQAAFAERFPLEFSVPVSGGGVQFEVGDTIEFDVVSLDDSWDVVAHAHILPEGEKMALTGRDDFKLVRDIEVDQATGGKIQIPFHDTTLDETSDTDRYQLFIRFEARRLKIRAGMSLVAEDDLFEHKYGMVAIDIVLRQRDPKFLICLDFGASAIAAWFGRVERNLARQLIPLGSFAYSLAGAHAEYDPNKKRWQNVLIPSTIGLNPTRHVRSRKAPLSYGNLSFVGTKLQAAEKRMALFGRTYDVSIPVDRDFLADGESSAFLELQTIVIPDLKRMLMNAEPEFKYRIKQSVIERTTNGLQSTREINLAALTRDAFHELGSYMIPNSLFHAHDQLDGPIVSEFGDERFDQWLECADSDVQVVVTHPSGIAHHKRELYKNAARAFAQGLTGTQDNRAAREPKLIPEALAAAYFGISRSAGRRDGTEIFACLDIGASTVDASLIEVKMRHDSIESWKVFAHFGATIGGANLDEALLAMLIQNLRELFTSTEPVFEDLELDHRFLRDEALKAALLPRIQQAKRALSDTLLRQASSDKEFGWALEGDGSCFVVELNDILRSATPGLPLSERDTAFPGSQDKVWLRVRTTSTGGQAISLEIAPDLLDADQPISNPTRSNPQTVARTLGYAVPAMLIREARRLNLGDPQWVITGRASLWPSVFTGIGRTTQLLGQSSDAAPMRPFAADDMKNATVYGAARLATSGLEITDGADHSYALVLHDDGRGVVSEIEYLDTRSRSEGNKSVRFLPNRWLSRVLPGLDDVGSDMDISRDEIVRLFGVFGQKVVVDQSQVKPGGLAGGQDQHVEISWKRRNSDVEFTVGDVIVRQPRSRLAGT